MESIRACATPARGSPCPGSGRATPTLPRRSPASLRASDFGAKIRQLEETGCRLRGEVDGILKESRQTQIVARKRGLSPENRFPIPLSDRQSMDDGDTASFSLHDLADISAEQRTIEAMKSRLEAHGAQAETLHSRVHRPASPVRIPTFPARSPGFDGRRVDLMLPPSILERELRESRQQSDFLKGQLDAAQRQASAELQESRRTIEDLKARLYDLQSQHEAQSRSQEEERASQTALVNGLREALQQLQNANREQEAALLQTNRKVDAAQHNFYLLESALSQLRALLVAAEQRRGRPFFDDPLPAQSATMLVHCVERCLQEATADAELKSGKLRQAEAALEEARKMADARMDDHQRQAAERLAVAAREAEGRLEELRRAEADSRQRAENAENRCRSLQQQVEEAEDRGRVHKNELTNRLHDLHAEAERQSAAWNDKRNALEDALDSAQREIAAAMSQRDTVMKETAETEAELQRSMRQRAETKAALDEETARRRHTADQCAHLQRQVTGLATQVEEKRLEVQALHEAAERSHAEHAQELSRVREEERSSGEKECTELSARAVSLTAELEQTKAELLEAQSSFNQLQTSLREATEGHNMLKIQAEGLADEKAHLQSIIGNRSAEVERLTAERDYYFNCLDEKTEEVAFLKAEKQRLIAQSSEMLDKLEGNFFRLEERLTDLKLLDQERSKQFGSCNHEKESMQTRFAEKDRELELLRVAKENLTRRLKAKEKQVKEMELDRERGGKELAERRAEVEAVYRERNQLFSELRESRQEALDMANDLEAVRAAARQREMALERQLDEANQRLQVSQPAVRSRVSAGRGRPQKEVATSRNQLTALQAKLKELEGNAVAVETERRRAKEENARLVRLMERMGEQNEKLSRELELYLGKQREAAGRLSKSEAAAEEAEERCRAVQRENEGLETELATLRCKLAVGQRPQENGHTAHEVSNLGANLRHTLGDVRSLLAEHADQSAADMELEMERRRRHASPVGQLLIERQRPRGKDVRWDESVNA